MQRFGRACVAQASVTSGDIELFCVSGVDIVGTHVSYCGKLEHSMRTISIDQVVCYSCHFKFIFLITL